LNRRSAMVREVCERLKADRLDVYLDQWHVREGEGFTTRRSADGSAAILWEKLVGSICRGTSAMIRLMVLIQPDVCQRGVGVTLLMWSFLFVCFWEGSRSRQSTNRPTCTPLLSRFLVITTDRCDSGVSERGSRYQRSTLVD